MAESSEDEDTPSSSTKTPTKRRAKEEVTPKKEDSVKKRGRKKIVKEEDESSDSSDDEKPREEKKKGGTQEERKIEEINERPVGNELGNKSVQETGTIVCLWDEVRGKGRWSPVVVISSKAYRQTFKNPRVLTKAEVPVKLFLNGNLYVRDNFPNLPQTSGDSLDDLALRREDPQATNGGAPGDPDEARHAPGQQLHAHQ